MPTWEFSVGDSVQLTKGTPDNGCLGFGDVGSVCQVAEESDDDEPYEVINESGKKWWYEDGQLAKASGNTKKPSTKKAKKKPAKKKQKTVAAAQDDENSEEQVEVAEAEGDGVLAGISDDDESDDEPAQEDAGDDDFDASNDEDGDDDEEFTTEKPKATRKRRREAPEENAGDNTEAPQGGTGTRSGRPRGNAFAPMDDQPIADPRVDPYCEINERQIEGKVVEFGEDGSPEQELYSVTLRKAPTGLATTTRTAVIQVIQFSRGGVARFCTFARWGAAGADGQKKATEHSYLDAAVKKFAEHYHSLTGNDWSARHNGFLKKEGKFEVVEIDVSANVADLSMTSDDRYGVAHPADEGVPLKLAPELASVVRDLSDFGKMYRQLEERGVELGRLPVCRFTKKHIRQGFTALKSLQFILSDIPGLDALSEEETAEIVTATYQFYAACPHVEEPDKITSSDQVAYLSETLTIMAEVEKAAETIRFERTVQTDVHPLDRDFALFKSRVELLDVDSSERNLIEGMISDTSMPNLDGYTLKVKDVFSLERKGEQVKYGPFAKLHNKQLLWHGSPTFSNRSVLRDGLLVQPPFAPSLGKTNGISFHDLANAAAQGCGPAPGQTASLVLAEVALGDVEQKRVSIDDTVEAPAKFYHSLQSIGAVLPDVEKSMDVSGVKWHLGPLSEEHAKLDNEGGGLGGQQHYNQFVVHDQSQFCLRYIVTVEFSGMKAFVPAEIQKSTSNTTAPVQEVETTAAGAARVTFAASVETSSIDDPAAAATAQAGGAPDVSASQSQPDELEEFSMTQDGPDYSQEERDLDNEASQQSHSQSSSQDSSDPSASSDPSNQTGDDMSGIQSQTAAAGGTAAAGNDDAGGCTAAEEATLQTFTASAPPANDEASAPDAGSMAAATADEYTLEMSESQDAEEEKEEEEVAPVAMTEEDPESSDGED